MPRNNGLGKLSYRGILAFAIGLVFMWFSLNPQSFNDDVPPIFVLVIMFLAGAALFVGGIISQRFVGKRSNLVRMQKPVTAEICVLNDDDRGTETVHVLVNGHCQALGVDRSGVVQKYLDGKVHPGEVWLDDNGKVHAIAISGKHFNTLIGGSAIPADLFGKRK